MTNEMNYLKVVFISLFLNFSFALYGQQKHQYIQDNKDLANELSQKYGIPSAIILGVAFVETGGGTSKNAKNSNNHFGIVGKNKKYKSKYKSFSSKRESFEAFCKLLSRKKYYAELKGNGDYKLWVQAIAGAGYSTQPKEWMRRVNLIIDKFQLSKQS
ncbi:MAG: glucosaminidase domain-containing protein [Flavobacteriaceae bacterium]|nr:glucosaminidase domain-containing protein [Flavobacteriaceae bacterium]